MLELLQLRMAAKCMKYAALFSVQPDGSSSYQGTFSNRGVQRERGWPCRDRVGKKKGVLASGRGLESVHVVKRWMS